MIYLDHGATSYPKPRQVQRAVMQAMAACGNPGRGGHPAAEAAARVVYDCRERAARLFDCRPEQVVFTANCTMGLNMAIHTIVPEGGRVVISGFEHNAVTRPLRARNAQLIIAGRRLFDWEELLTSFRRGLEQGADGAVFTHVSNVFGYILPVEEMARMCREYGVPFVIDAAQSAGMLPVKLRGLGADFIAMPGHKGLLGPMGTGLLLCGGKTTPLLFGGTGMASMEQEMPGELPERLEAGTMNVPGIAGLSAGIALAEKHGEAWYGKARKITARTAELLQDMGATVFSGEHQGAVLSFLLREDGEETARRLGQQGIALRAGLHCAPLAHKSARTIETGTVRLSFGHTATMEQAAAFLKAAAKGMGMHPK